MNDVTKTLETLLAWSELHPDSGVRLSDGRVANGKDIQAAVFSLQDKIANQTRWLVESRQRENEALDALKDMTESRAEWEQIANEYKAKLTTPTPPRRLREYKGVTYRDGLWWLNGCGYRMAADVIAKNSAAFTDADHAALLALRDDPWEPVETLESIIEPALTRSYTAGEGYSHGTWIGTEQLSKEVSNAIRAHLATQPQAITPKQAVAVLVEKGAKRCQFIDVGGNGLVLTRGGFKGEKLVSVLILPEPTP